MKKILFIVATHGHESFSIPVLQKLEKEFDKKEFQYDWIIGNPRALEMGVRFADADLNRSAPGDKNSKLYEERRAAEILEIAKDYDLVFDIHGTRALSGIVTIVSYPTLENIFLSALLPIDNVVIWNSFKSRVKGPLAQYMQKPAVGIECGPKMNKEVQDELFMVLEKILTTLRSPSLDIINKSNFKKFFAVYEKMEGNKRFTDFKKYKIDSEEFYPFLGNNEYQNISCYKMKKVKFADLFLSDKN